VVVLAVVLVMFKLVIVEVPETSDPVVICPTIPSPPEIVRAPVDVVVLGVVLVMLVTPLTESVPVIVVLFAERETTVVFPDERVPVVICPMTPSPPDTVRAPDDDVVLGVAFVMVTRPEEVMFPVVKEPEVI